MKIPMALEKQDFGLNYQGDPLHGLLSEQLEAFPLTLYIQTDPAMTSLYSQTNTRPQTNKWPCNEPRWIVSKENKKMNKVKIKRKKRTCCNRRKH